MNSQKQAMPEEQSGRSVHSEYDYGAKRKFVDVLGNFKTEGKKKLGGLSGLEEFK